MSKAYKIAHFGAYSTNIGDTVAINNIRIQLAKLLESEIEWVPVSIIDFMEQKNEKNYTIAELRRLTTGCDALIIGGGGLIEGGKFCEKEASESGWKMPFTEEVFQELDLQMPIFVVGVGVNYFRNIKGFTGFKNPETGRSGIEAFRSLIKRSDMFSVRNDGSLECAKALGLPESLMAQIEEIPDPGLIYDYENERLTTSQIQKQEKLKVFQPAFNKDRWYMIGRFVHDDNWNKVLNTPPSLDLAILPHTSKDYEHWDLVPSHPQAVWPLEYFQENAGIEKYQNLLDIYKNIGVSIAMRGHGQMIALGLNVPSIYFSTQDKVLNFSLKHDGLVKYTVDIRGQELGAPDPWYEMLPLMYENMIHNENYLINWYNIRDKLILDFKAQFNDFCQRMAERISST